MEKINKWSIVKDYFKRKTIANRKTYMEKMKPFMSVQCADNYRCYLERAGYLLSEGKGIYVRVRPINKDLSLRQVKVEAYGKC